MILVPEQQQRTISRGGEALNEERHARLAQWESRHVGRNVGVSHLSPQIRIDGELEYLEENASIEGNCVEVDGLCCIVDGVLSGFRISYNKIWGILCGKN